jgi:hypothetical protein
MKSYEKTCFEFPQEISDEDYDIADIFQKLWHVKIKEFKKVFLSQHCFHFIPAWAVEGVYYCTSSQKEWQNCL